MQNRHSLENTLQTEIENYNPENIESIKHLIQLIESWKGPNPPTLESLNAEGQSFLISALETNAIDIANILFEIQKENSSILFGKDQNHKTLLWHAASKGQTHIVQAILKLEEKTKLEKDVKNSVWFEASADGHSPLNIGIGLEDGPQEPVWLQADNEGDSPLHIAIRNGHYDVVLLLLEKIKNCGNYSEIINLINHKMNTPLHEALDALSQYSENIEKLSAIIAKLISLNADLTLPNENEKTPATMFFKLEFKKQALISELYNANRNPQKQKLLFNIMFEGLDPETRKKEMVNLKKHAGKKSLQDLLIIFHELDENAIIPTNIEMKRISKDGKETKDNDPESQIAFYATKQSHDEETGESSTQYIPLDDLLNRIPTFKNRLLQANGLEPVKQNQLRSMEYEYQSVNNAIQFTDKLIKEIEAYIANLPPAEKKHHKGWLVPLFGSIGSFLGVEAFFIYKTVLSGSPGWIAGSILFGEFGIAIAGFIAACAGYKLAKGKEVKISRSDWENLNKIVNETLQNLQSLEKNYAALSPNVRNMETNNQFLNQQNLARQTLIATLEGIKSQLQTIKKEMISSQRFFKPQEKALKIPAEAKNDVVIDMPNSMELNHLKPAI